MKIEIKVPSMGESLSEATVGTILKPSGSTVQQDEELTRRIFYKPEGEDESQRVTPRTPRSDTES